MQKYQRLVERRLLTLLAASEHVSTSYVCVYRWKEGGYMRVRRVWLGLEIANIVNGLATAVVLQALITWILPNRGDVESCDQNRSPSDCLVISLYQRRSYLKILFEQRLDNESAALNPFFKLLLVFDPEYSQTLV